MQLFGILFCFFVGVSTAVGMILTFDKDQVFNAASFLRRYIDQIREANSRRTELEFPTNGGR